MADEADLGESVDFDQIVRALFTVAGDDPRGGLALELTGTAGRLPAVSATPLAMCGSELVDNAVQHSRGTFVEVSAHREPGRLRIDIRDDGVGMPKSAREDPGLGLQIVDSLATTELAGTFSFADEPYGTRAIIDVPLPS